MLDQYEKMKKKAEEARNRAWDRKQNRLKSKNAWKQYIDSAYKLIPYEPRWNIHNSDTHELAKGRIALLAKRGGRLCYCEVILKGMKGRPDCFFPHEEMIIEVLETETVERFRQKEGYYPEGWLIVPLRAKEVLKEGFIL